MATADLKNMDVDALLTLRADVEKMLVEKGRDLQRQLTRLGVEAGKGERRLPAGMGRTSAMKGVKIAPQSIGGPAGKRGPAGARRRDGSLLCSKRGIQSKSF